MKPLNEYGLLNDDEWEYLPWIDHDTRPPFVFRDYIRERLSPFFIVEHHPMAVSILLRISDNYKADVFKSCGLTGSSENWERLARLIIPVYESENSGIDMFHFDSDEDIFCIYSEYVDNVIKFVATYLNHRVCKNDEVLKNYLIKIN